MNWPLKIKIFFVTIIGYESEAKNSKKDEAKYYVEDNYI